MSTTAGAQAIVSEVTDWFGLDVSKATLDWSSRPAGSPPANAKVIHSMTFAQIERSRQAVANWHAEHLAVLGPDRKAGVVMEATAAYSLEVAAWLRECDEDIHISIITPKLGKRFGELIGMNNKTDDIDGRVLACFGAERRPACIDKPDAATRLLRPLTRALLNLVEHRTAVKQQRNELKSDHLDKKTARMVLSSFDQVVATLDKQIAKLEAQIKKVLEDQPELKTLVDKLDEIKGVGPAIATTIIAELGDIRRFSRSRQLTAFAGLNPVVRRSGTSVNKRTRMSKCGSARARRALYLSAMVNANKNNPFGALYRKLIQRGMAKMAALGVVMRRTLAVMRAVLKSGKYDPELLYTRWHLEPNA